MSSIALADLQTELSRYLLDGDNEPLLVRRILSPGSVPAESRLDVYRNAYFQRLEDALAHDFPCLLAVCGEELFGELALGYVQAHPSVQPSLRWFGRDLPGWLRAQEGRELLADVVELEWSILHAFDAADAPRLPRQALSKIPAERWPNLRLMLHPSVTLIALRANAREIWQALARSRVPPRLHTRSDAERLVIWRTATGPSVVATDAASHGLLTSWAGGATFAEACESLTRATALPPADVAERAAHCLKQALDLGWLCAGGGETK